MATPRKNGDRSNKREGMAGVYEVIVWNGLDTTLTETSRGVIIGTAGALQVRLKDMTSTVTIPVLPVGEYPFWIDEIVAAGTTASNITFEF